MVAILPVLVGVTGYVAPFGGAFGGVVTSTQVVTTNGVRLNVKDLKLSIHFFASVSDGDTWDLAPRRAVAVAWQGNDVDTHHVIPSIESRIAGSRNAIVRFDAAAGANAGWLWVLSRS